MCLWWLSAIVKDHVVFKIRFCSMNYDIDLSHKVGLEKLSEAKLSSLSFVVAQGMA